MREPHRKLLEATRIATHQWAAIACAAVTRLGIVRPPQALVRIPIRNGQERQSDIDR